MLTKWRSKLRLHIKKNPKLVWGFFLGAAGLLYIKVWLPTTRLGIPCVFHEVTGLYCPGCGVTRAAASLLQFDLVQAFRYNALLFLLLPLYALYVVMQKKQWRRSSQALMTGMVIITILFGVLRNFPAFAWLAPTSLL
ncbi:DUF2752 domain-containing protein [Paenibacillus soyae]|uniref:DUF2752 domain-containing protein n=1 Tax=Paenibacillus soyae TaxID=2969249 RepID=A0A9X2MV51_9BACL|nr:DUF2752 domain-containing protein [Paenibacillus soyae]MCR2806897.1 DUF2752 domain-containing protein [Paenibacillus soyae]